MYRQAHPHFIMNLITDTITCRICIARACVHGYGIAMYKLINKIISLELVKFSMGPTFQYLVIYSWFVEYIAVSTKFFNNQCRQLAGST